MGQTRKRSRGTFYEPYTEGEPCPAIPAAVSRRVEPWRTDVVSFARKAGFEPDEPQVRVLQSEARRGILNCTRQWGKSTVTAAKALHHVLTGPATGSKRLVVVGCPTARQSGEFLRKVSGMLPGFRIAARGDGIHEASLLLPNGSRIVGLPQNEEGVRGLSGVTLLVIDEASRVGDGFYKALRPMLSTTNGALWLLSTPCEKRGFFYEAWEHGGDLWERIRVTAPECGRIPSEFLEEERRSLGQAWFRQEYMAEFMDIGGGFFGRDVVEAALTDDLEVVNLDMGR